MEEGKKKAEGVRKTKEARGESEGVKKKMVRGEKRSFKGGLAGKKVALVCDWLTNVGGAEKVLLELHRLFPEASIYTSQYRPRKIDWFLDAEVRTGWLQIFPAGFRRFLGPFRQKYFEHLNLKGYDLVISVTGAEAKAVSAPDGKHISYCHVPTQYYWQMYDEYIKNPGFGILNPIVRFFFKILVKPLRKADFGAAQRVDKFITISDYAKELILKYYKRDAKIIHPPVDLSNFSISGGKSQEGKTDKVGNILAKKQVKGKNIGAKSQEGSFPQVVKNFGGAEGYYITTSRQVNWKRLDLAVLACLKLRRSLLVVGEGPEHRKLVKLAEGADCKKPAGTRENVGCQKLVKSGEETNLIKFLPLAGKAELAEYLAGAKGYLFPSLEPFGIAPVEALAAGCPVIAFYEGGARDYVVDGENGVLFNKQTVKVLEEAILRFEKMKFSREKVARTAEKFRTERFDAEILKVLESDLEK